MMTLLKISELAEISGISVHRIRNYLDEHLISCCERTSGGHQLFSQDCLDKLALLQEARNAGLLIQEIKPLLLAMQGDDREAIHDAVCALSRLIDCRNQNLAALKTQLVSIENGGSLRSLP